MYVLLPYIRGGNKMRKKLYKVAVCSSGSDNCNCIVCVSNLL